MNFKIIWEKIFRVPNRVDYNSRNGIGLTRRRVLQTLGPGAAAAISCGPMHSAASELVRVAAIYTVPVTQRWVSRIHEAATSAVIRGDIKYTYSDRVAPGEFERILREYTQGEHQLIIGETFAVEELARQIASDHTDKYFLMGSRQRPNPFVPNFSVFQNNIQDASFLSGIIAGAVTKSGTIGIVGGFPVPEANRLIQAFMAGARHYRNDLVFEVSFISSWFNPRKAKETAFAQMDAGADVMYAEQVGVADAARERGKLAIGNVVNSQADFPNTVVVSALWHFAPTLRKALLDVRDGNFQYRDYGYCSFLRNGGCAISSLGTFNGTVPEDALELVAEKEYAIRIGQFNVEIIDDEPISG